MSKPIALFRDRRGGISVGFLLGILNTIFVLAALGTLIYTRVLYKRPSITEEGERQRLAAEQEKKQQTELVDVGTVEFEPFTVNIRSLPVNGASEGTTTQPAQAKMHFAKIAMSLQIRDKGKKGLIDEVRPILMDKLLTLFGNKSFNEITTVQGRYLVRNDILELVNELVKEPLVMNVFFTEFLVQ